MPTITTFASGDPALPQTVSLSSAQAGNGDTTNVADRGGHTSAALLTVATVAGATPTCTYAVMGSIDNVNWFAVNYADSATPTALSVATFAIVATLTAWKIIPSGTPYRYLKVTYSANTNITNTVTATFF
jgi:hypothetical protein